MKRDFETLNWLHFKNLKPFACPHSGSLERVATVLGCGGGVCANGTAELTWGKLEVENYTSERTVGFECIVVQAPYTVFLCL